MRIIVSFTATIHKKSPQISSSVVLFDYLVVFPTIPSGKTSPDNFAYLRQNIAKYAKSSRVAGDDKEEDEREDDTDGGQGADERGLVYEAVVGGGGREGRGEEKKGWGEAKAKNAQAAATTTPIRCRRTRPRPAPDPELDPEPETVGGHSAGAPLLRRSARLVAWVLLLRLWAKTGVAVSVPAAVRENFRCISGRGCTVLSTMGLLEREGDLPPVQVLYYISARSEEHDSPRWGGSPRRTQERASMCGAWGRSIWLVEILTKVLNAHLGGPISNELHLIERRSYSMAGQMSDVLDQSVDCSTRFGWTCDLRLGSACRIPDKSWTCTPCHACKACIRHILAISHGAQYAKIGKNKIVLLLNLWIPGVRLGGAVSNDNKIVISVKNCGRYEGFIRGHFF
ncbi:hypothetical protein B0H14DRAFT_2568137 [Mycena olivaceomarginata]|nr:hypothetical protein B0H14DRAFT_2568137 [Mycena olivaceomarginata]